MASEENKARFIAGMDAAIDKYVKQQARNTIALNAENDPACAGYARIPGPDACDFCVTMGAANDFYHTSDTAGGGARHGTEDDAYHPYCNCSIVAVFEKNNRLVARDVDTGDVIPYDGSKFAERYDEIGMPTYSGKGGVRYASTRSINDPLGYIRSAKTVEEVEARFAEVYSQYKRIYGEKRMQKYVQSARSVGKRRVQEIEAGGAAAQYEERVKQNVIAVKMPDYSRFSKKQYSKLTDNEIAGHMRLAELRHDVMPLPVDRAAAANIDMIMDGEYWELKTPIGTGGRLRTRLDEGISKWTRLNNAGVRDIGTPKIVVDNRFSSMSDKDAIDIIKEKMQEHSAAGFDEAMIIRKNGRTSRIRL